MENDIIDSNLSADSTNLLTSEAIGLLRTIGKWAKFLAIMGFILIGFMLLAGIFIGGILSRVPNAMATGMPTGVFTLIYFGLGALYFFPVLYLYRFANYIEKALAFNSPQQLTQAFSNLKSHYKFIGIVVIAMIAFYVLMFFGAILFAFLK